MKSILTGTFSALVLGAAIASSQTPPASQAPSQPAGGQTQPGAQGQPTEQRSTTAKGQTYRGFLRGSDASGWTIAPLEARSGATGTAGATATSGADTTTYTVVAAEGAKVNLTSMADQCVEVVGVAAPAGAGARSSSDAAGGAESPAAGAAGTRAGANRTLTITTVKAVEGGCKQ